MGLFLFTFTSLTSLLAQVTTQVSVSSDKPLSITTARVILYLIFMIPSKLLPSGWIPPNSNVLILSSITYSSRIYPI